MFQKTLLFMVSLNKSNREAERKILIEAGLITPYVENTWVHYYASANGRTFLYLANNYRIYNHWNVPLIISASDLLTIFSLKTINPNIAAEDLLKAIKLNARNKNMLSYSGFKLE